MKYASKLVASLAALALLFLSGSFATNARAEGLDAAIESRSAEVEGVKLHYLTAGKGSPLILLHGYAETSRMWKPIMPLLAGRFTVIAPDLPGIGDSAIPADGLDMKTAAIRIHALARSLGVGKARVVGHDIGLMVAYAYAAQYPAEVEKLVLMDAFLPGVGQWEAVCGPRVSVRVEGSEHYRRGGDQAPPHVIHLSGASAEQALRESRAWNSRDGLAAQCALGAVSTDSSFHPPRIVVALQ